MRRVCLTLALLVTVAPGWAQVPEIRSDVDTDYGTYRPLRVAVAPAARQFAVDAGLANVENAADFVLDAARMSMLEGHGFFVAPGRQHLYAEGFPVGSAYLNFADVYIEAQELGIPAYVTPDAMLHVFHRIFDHVLMSTEEGSLLPALEELDLRLLARLAAVHDQASDSEVLEAARLAATYVAVAARLLDRQAEIPDWAEADVAAELTRIDAHAGLEPDPLFAAFQHDYSQYVPRGHYTRSEALERYFLAMMWHGRVSFGLREMWTVGGPPGARRPDLTMAALLLTRELELGDGDTSLEELWQTVYTPTVFMVGESEDPVYTQYADLAEAVYGAPLVELEPDAICDPEMIGLFMDRAETELPQPRIRTPAPQGLRLFGQRFIPDSWYFSQLVFPAVDGRLMPSVLDVMSVLGSAEAERLQRQAGEAEYPGYRQQQAALRVDVAEGSAERWASTLYWSWLYTLGPLLQTWGEGFPPFMRDSLWPRRQLMAAAGSWTELRHDTILYAKQSYTGETSGPPVARFVQGYVEPDPWVFARLAALAAYARTGLDGLGTLDSDSEARLSQLEEGALLCARVAANELARRPVTGEQFRFIYSFGDWLEEVLALDEEVHGGGEDEDRAPVVADVHTDPNSAQVLEEGTDYPGRVFVVADVEGRLQLCVGAVFVPHEFTWPMSDRLTDEAWWELLENDPPRLPWWVEPVLDSATPVPADPRPGARTLFDVSSAEVTLERHVVARGQDLVVHCSPAANRVELRAPGVQPVEVPLGGDGDTVVVSTDELPAGEVILVAELGDGSSYALRAAVALEVEVLGDPPAPRRGGGRRP